MAVLFSPVKNYTGPGPAGVHFTEGRAETDDPAALAYAHRHGYRVETTPKRKTAAAKTETPKE
ncbi:hypothetical protein KQH42_07305 [Streptomyces sp. CHA1]|uniref:hypothetical protein n=1 Tax=Streptomyces TaxID=1883 RepID=UPI00101E6558|nr:MULTISPECIES: hypothetical protein [Streptomyces]MBT3157353.1 hypothetical protein [Streptomyces sp. G11C]MCO6700322.1 hypothetical protein [Streptomyces sp. CHB9.2]MCO6706458.1 hypothetical protein [Streptomyces sp. CHA3]MCO6712200.1 hypothetical protein [Streptomyces sp. CHB19.2]MCO6718634.1 hypothetical protein [Streptomyces sp. Vc714c-19]